ncbi:MAG TPA: hypothetical protein DEB66_06500 [Micrococcaceae bacterium]|nr:hypothetical protein [Micrococcaceae bacterium]
MDLPADLAWPELLGQMAEVQLVHRDLDDLVDSSDRAGQSVSSAPQEYSAGLDLAATCGLSLLPNADLSTP